MKKGSKQWLTVWLFKSKGSCSSVILSFMFQLPLILFFYTNRYATGECFEMTNSLLEKKDF